ncbi:hypothetical protein [Paraburkholderia phenoliruptrix]|uniref:hypothetical protein n=1 Tax=Paraburkholderia phenoliruptrix TaxID=252970 RepID=UPI003D98380E
MSKNKKQSQADSRPPVDALQYEKLALSAFHLCDRQMSKLDTLIALASTIGRNPAVTTEERCRQQTMLDLLVSTAEQYRRELACDRELFQVIALDSKGVARKRITASHAARLLHAAADISIATQLSGAPASRHAAAPADTPSSDDPLEGGSGSHTTQH